MKQKFREFILNDIFYFDKSEFNFGVYKIFRQKQKLIENTIDEIINEVESKLSTAKNIKELQEILEDELPGKIYKQIDFHNIDLEKLKDEIKEYASEDILEKLDNKNYSSTKIYEYLYQFFNLYYETGDFGYTTRSFNVYKVPFKENIICEDSQEIDYRGEETQFTWKTKDSYYIKSNKFLNTLNLKLNFNNKEYKIKADIIGKDKIKDDKKVKQYRLVLIQKNDNTIYLKFNLSDTPTPKHTLYLLILTLIEANINEINYDEYDDEVKYFFEELPLKRVPTSSLFDNSKEVIGRYKTIYNKYIKYLVSTKKEKGKEKFINIFKYQLGGKEDEKQIKSKVSQLMVSKKDYANKVYNKTEAKNFLDVKKFDFDNKNDRERLYEKDKLLNFFYRLDRGINLFFAGIDSDYFIHKNLKRFLLLELDKFIKNYILADTDAILDMKDTQLFKFAKIFKKEAIKIIELLDSIEKFQKYIWEKRKLIKKTYYIVSSNKLKNNEELLEKVLGNEKQINEWINLGLCDKKPNIDELKEKPYPIDTKYFNESFKYEVLSKFDNLEEEIDGILIKSENFQALKFLESKFKENIKCIYIDPPYNTGSDGFVYKDNYKEASWLSMMNDRLNVAKNLMKDDGVIFNQIDDKEQAYLKILMDQVFKSENFINVITVKTKIGGVSGSSEGKSFQDSMEFMNVFAKNKKDIYFNSVFKLTPLFKYITSYKEKEKSWKYTSIIIKLEGKKKIKETTEYTLYSYDVFESQSVKSFAIENKLSEEEVYRKYNNRIFRTTNAQSSVRQNIINETKKFNNPIVSIEYIPIKGKNKGIKSEIFYKDKKRNMLMFLSDMIEEKEGMVYYKEKLNTLWDDIQYNNLSKEGNIDFSNGKKPEKLLERIINLSIPEDSREWVLDFFVGSGTTPAVAYKMNKKFIGIEINDYFDNLILKRMKYTMFENSGGIKSKKEGGLIQYIYLEQYDDIIDNLKTKDKIEKLEVEAKYIYNPDKNQIDFRIEDDIKNPLNGNFDIFHSFIYHKGHKLKKVIYEDNILIGELDNEEVLILGNEEEKITNTIKHYENKKIYTNIKYPNTYEIDIYTFRNI